ncbi:MAG: alpha/beta hydrolase [Planctomycetota bacterium]
MGKISKLLLRIFVILIAVYLGILVIVYLGQDKMLYYPNRDITDNPNNIGLSYIETVFTTTDNVRITGWYIPATPERGTVLFCHGNAGNISTWLNRISLFNKMNLSTLIFDYRGYGKSSGSPSENGTYLDAEAGWDYLINTQKKPPFGCIIYGHSLGGAIAAEIALRKNPAVLVIESSFTSVPDFGSRIYPWLPVCLISRYHYATIDKISLINCSKLIIHSPTDETVPFEYGRALYEKASEPKQFLEIQGDHNNGFINSGEIYRNGLKSFLDRYVKSNLK